MSANPTATNCSPGGGMDLVKATKKKHATMTPAKEHTARMAAFTRSFFSPSRRRFSRMACMQYQFFGVAPNITFHSLALAMPMTSTVFPVGTDSSTWR